MKRRWIHWVGCLAAVGAWAGAAVPDAEKVEVFADAFLGSRFRIAELDVGPFGDPAEDPEFFRLRSGASILDEAGERLGVDPAFRPYRVLSGIQGDMDTWIFVRQARDTTRFPEFQPAEETQWVAVLREVLDEAGRPLWHDSRFTRVDREAMPFLDKDNLFLVYRGGGGAVCIGWPEERSAAVGVHPRELADDLRLIQASQAGKEGAPDMTGLQADMATAFGRAVVREILARRKPLPPGEQIERDLRDLLRAVEWREISYAVYRDRRAEYEAQEWVRAERQRQREERERAQAVARAQAEYEQGRLPRDRYEEMLREWGIPAGEWPADLR